VDFDFLWFHSGKRRFRQLASKIAPGPEKCSAGAQASGHDANRAGTDSESEIHSLIQREWKPQRHIGHKGTAVFVGSFDAVFPLWPLCLCGFHTAAL
jgi:hypothetical protein